MENRQRYLVRLRPGTLVLRIYMWIDTSNGEEPVKIQSTSYLTPVPLTRMKPLAKNTLNIVLYGSI